jgi:MOSC domain-containing protein YiiM
MKSKIEQILSSPEHGKPQSEQATAALIAGTGLSGDRYAGSGVVSLIEAEAVAAFNAASGLAIRAADTGRNLVTRGVALNELVGKRFRIGEAELEGTELCEPCATLGRSLATDAVSAAEVVRHFARSAGLRARVLSDGDIQPGSEIATG